MLIKLKSNYIEKSEKDNGITLVALVITVIIIIILATVTLNFTFGENGIITKANQAKYMAELSSFKEELGMWQMGKSMEYEDFEAGTVVAGENSLTYAIGDKEVMEGNIYDVIQSLRNSDFAGKLEVIGGELLLNSTDNLLISVMLGTIIVGYYSNYSMIISAISLIITTMATAISASVGNLNAQTDSKQNYKIFNVLVYLFNFITTVGMIGFFLVINDFIKVWIGDSYILSTDVVLAIAISFYISNSQSPIWMYREALGLFKEVKYTGLAAAIINLVLSIILGKIIGLAGILIATPISKLCTTSLFEPIIIFKKSFHMSTKKYFITQIKYFCIMILALSVSIFVCHFVQFENIFVKMILKGIISVVISVIICILLTRKTEEYKELKSRAMDKLKFIKVKG